MTWISFPRFGHGGLPLPVLLARAFRGVTVGIVRVAPEVFPRDLFIAERHVYKERMASLYQPLQQEDTRAQATDIIRSLVSEIVLTPTDGVLQVELRGDLAGILTIATAGKQSGRPDNRTAAVASQVKMVARTRNGRDRHSLQIAI